MPPRKKSATKAEDTPTETPAPAPFWTAKALDRESLTIKDCKVSVDGKACDATAVTAQECPEALFPGALVVCTNIYGSAALGVYIRTHNGSPEVRELGKPRPSRHSLAHVHILLSIEDQEVFQNTRSLFRDTTP